MSAADSTLCAGSKMTPWITYLHHVTIHFPIVMLLGMSGVGLYASKHDIEPLQRLVRWGGWLAFGLTTIAMITGILSAPGWLGGDGPKALSDHRDLALTTWFLTAVAAPSYDLGVRAKDRDWRLFGVGAWCVAAFAVIGAGHWGGLQHHPEALPWSQPPRK